MEVRLWDLEHKGIKLEIAHKPAFSWREYILSHCAQVCKAKTSQRGPGVWDGVASAHVAGKLVRGAQGSGVV